MAEILIRQRGDRKNKELAVDIAYAAGSHAAREGATKEQISKWMQSAYSCVWVRMLSLNPGLDMKEVRGYVLFAFMKTKNRTGVSDVCG